MVETIPAEELMSRFCRASTEPPTFTPAAPETVMFSVETMLPPVDTSPADEDRSSVDSARTTPFSSTPSAPSTVIFPSDAT